MKRIAAAVVITIALGLYVGLAGAANLPIGKATLSGTVLDWDGDTITAKGNASFVLVSPRTPLKAGSMRLESMKAETITLSLTTEKNRRQTLKEASAAGGVIIKAKRADQETDGTGELVTVVRDVIATARAATLMQAQDAVKLTGSVVVKVMEPGVAEPVAVLAGETVTFFLKENKIRVEGQPDKPAEFTVTPKEDENK